MLNRVFNNIKEKGMLYCDIPTHCTNSGAIRLYKSLGFKQKDNYIEENGNILLIKEM